MDFETYDTLLSTIYAAGAGEEPLIRMFQQIRTALNAFGSGVSVYDPTDRIITHTLISSRSPASKRALSLLRPLNQEPGARLVTGARSERAQRFTDIVPEARLQGTRWYQLQKELTGIGPGIVADVMASGLRLRLFVTRSSNAENFNHDEVDLVGRLASHVRRAFSNSVRRFSPDQSARGLAVIVYHEDKIAPIFLTKDRMLPWAVTRFGLSRAEARVLAVMSEGMTRSLGATELGIGTDTLKSHMRRIYAKTGTSRLPDLMRMLRGALSDQVAPG